jgi:sulfoxide reductase catalytic subunit YedY
MYDVHKIQNMKHELTSLAYEMNGASSTAMRERTGFQDGQIGRSHRVVHDFVHLCADQGGYNENHDFYGCRMDDLTPGFAD